MCCSWPQEKNQQGALVVAEDSSHQYLSNNLTKVIRKEQEISSSPEWGQRRVQWIVSKPGARPREDGNKGCTRSFQPTTLMAFLWTWEPLSQHHCPEVLDSAKYCSSLWWSIKYIIPTTLFNRPIKPWVKELLQAPSSGSWVYKRGPEKSRVPSLQALFLWQRWLETSSAFSSSVSWSKPKAWHWQCSSERQLGRGPGPWPCGLCRLPSSWSKDGLQEALG